MDVTSQYPNILQEQGITKVCRAYEHFLKNNLPVPTNYIKEMLRLILKENSYQFNGKNYLQIHGTSMGTKIAITIASIFIANIKTQRTFTNLNHVSVLKATLNVRLRHSYPTSNSEEGIQR